MLDVTYLTAATRYFGSFDSNSLQKLPSFSAFLINNSARYCAATGLEVFVPLVNIAYIFDAMYSFLEHPFRASSSTFLTKLSYPVLAVAISSSRLSSEIDCSPWLNTPRYKPLSPVPH